MPPLSGGRLIYVDGSLGFLDKKLKLVWEMSTMRVALSLTVWTLLGRKVWSFPSILGTLPIPKFRREVYEGVI